MRSCATLISVLFCCCLAAQERSVDSGVELLIDADGWTSDDTGGD